MSWIESHQELGRHPKTRRMAKQLGVSLPAVVGHLHYLWWWAMDFAQDGDVTGFDNDEVAEAALWDGNSVEFFQALASSGFIDVIHEEGQDEKCILHDWGQYGPFLSGTELAGARLAWDKMRPFAAPVVFERDGPLCSSCGSLDDLTIDHIKPLSRGGTNTLDNLTPLCRSCNSSKGNRQEALINGVD